MRPRQLSAGFVDALWRTDAAETGLHDGAKEDNALLNELFSLMARERSDYTRTFHMLSLTEQHSAASPLRDEFIDRAAFDDWFARYRGVCNKTRLAIVSVSN